MGHIHLGVLPRTRRWRDVVDALTSGASDGSVIAASASAAERDLLRAAEDPVFIEAVRLLLAIPLAARAEDFGDALRAADLGVGSNPSVIDIVAASVARLDAVARARGRRSDFGELSARALARTLTKVLSAALPSLFAATPAEVRAAARQLSYSKGIAVLARAFFGALVGSSLSYWLDRTLPLQIGPGHRFDTMAQRSAFDVALHQYTSEATRIIQEFAGGWYGKTLHDKGGFDSQDAARFGAVSLKKISEELRMRWSGDA